MILSKKQLRYYIEEDAKANRRKTIKAKFYGDEVWRFIVTMRKLDYYGNKFKKNKFYFLRYIYSSYLYHKYSLKLGFSISNYNNIGFGFSIAHFGSIVINSSAVIGNYCRIHEGVCIGSTNGNKEAPIIGDYVFIGTGAKIIGNISICSFVSIGANAVVVKSICESHSTWAGVPAKMISSQDSLINLSPLIEKDLTK